jgi:Na+/H+-dicarboxylate symporter
MMIVPLVASSIVIGVANAGDPKNLGRLGSKTFAFYISTSFMAIIVGLILSNIIQPGRGVELDLSQDGEDIGSKLQKPGSLFEIVLRMIPTNPIEAAAEMDMLGIIFFAIVTGIGLTLAPKQRRDAIIAPLDAFFHVMMQMTAYIIALAPIGVFGLITKAVYILEPEVLLKVLNYMLTVALGLGIHLFVSLPLLYFFFMKKNPIRQFRHMRNALLTAFSSSSSSATLPVTLDCLENRAGVSNKISSFVVPLGATVNMDGTALYECAGVLFIAQLLGIPLDFNQQLLIVITALLASIGAAGIPSAGLVMIFVVLEAVGIQGPEVNIIVGTMLAVDRPLDMFRTAVNVFSDSVGTVVIANSEGEIDDSIADSVDP